MIDYTMIITIMQWGDDIYCGKYMCSVSNVVFYDYLYAYFRATIAA